MKWMIRLMLLVLPAFAMADAGHDHADAAPAASAGLVPRVEAQSEAFELVGILEGSNLRIYLDRFASNEPVPNARIQIESGAFNTVAQPLGDGVYTAAAGAFAAPGQYPLVFAVQTENDADLLNGTLTVPRPAGQAAHEHDWSEWLVWVGAGAVLVFSVLWLLRRRIRALRTGTAPAIALAVLIAYAGAPAAVLADAGHDHDKKAGNPATLGASAYPDGGNAGARRLADGSVFMPKPVQRELGVRTIVAEMHDLARSIELNGRVVADPNAGGRVQSSQPGRIEPGPRGLPALGHRVSKHEVLAYIRPVANAIDLGNQRAKLAELAAQHALAEKRVRRLEALEGSVPQKEIEAARGELASLAERRAAVSGSLSNREALTAPVAGVISSARAVAGQVVDAREILFEVIDPQRLMVEALAYDAAIVSEIADASAALPGGRALGLEFAGGAPQLREQALPLLFRIKGPPPPLAVGQPLKVVAQTRQTFKGVAVPLAALARNGAGETVVWVHAGAETFAVRKVRHLMLDGAHAALTEGIAAGERIVAAGASLSQVR